MYSNHHCSEPKCIDENILILGGKDRHLFFCSGKAAHHLWLISPSKLSVYSVEIHKLWFIVGRGLRLALGEES